MPNGSTSVVVPKSVDEVMPRTGGLVDRSPIRILLVDDSHRNLAALQAVLGDLDAEVVTAGSGADALRALLKQDFALILLDVRMPGMDGFETAELIRSRDRSRFTPIIFVTAFDRPRNDEIRGYGLGAVDFLAKPLVPEVLRAKVGVVIELQRKSEEIRRQAALLDEARRRGHARAMEVERRRWEEEALRARVERERQAAALLARANARLRVLSETASDLLLLPEPEPDGCVGELLFRRVAEHLELELAAWFRTSDVPPTAAVVSGLEPAQLASLGASAEGPVARAIASRARVVLRPSDAAGIGAGVAIPLVAGATHHGVLVFATRAARVLDDDEHATLELLARGLVATLERWRLVCELQERAAQLKEADHRKDQFLAMLGHELRNPLAPVVNAVKLMKEFAPPDDPRHVRVASAADRQIRHMTRLLDDLLDVSRIRNGKIELKRVPLDLREAVHDAVCATEAALSDREQALSVVVPDEPVAVDGDPVRLAQVFSNLLHNASKYTNHGGHVEVRLLVRGRDRVVVVRDDGIGIPAEMLPRVFDVFVQVEQGPDRARGGLGLGLTLVRSLVEMHGGRVSVSSDGLDHGTTFEVILPAPSEETSRAVARAADGESAASLAGAGGAARWEAGRSLRIVLVDDNSDVRDSLKALLELRGHVVEDAPDGPAAIERISSASPEVALVDIGLPGMDGYEVARTLRAAHAPTRLVAMTGYGRPEDRRLALEAGFDAHLVKPVDLDELTRLLDEITQPPPRSTP